MTTDFKIFSTADLGGTSGFEPDVGPGPRDPEDETEIYRYVPFTVACDILLNKRLYFRRLSSMDDRGEGAMRRLFSEVSAINRRRLELAECAVEADEHRYKWDFLPSRELFASCWQMAAGPDDLMFRAYGANVALKSTVGQLRKSLEANGVGGARAGAVRYSAPKSADVPGQAYAQLDTPSEENRWWPGFLKDECFRNERELRFLVHCIDDRFQGTHLPLELADGFSIDDILVRPYDPDFELEALRKVCQHAGAREPRRFEASGPSPH